MRLLDCRRDGEAWDRLVGVTDPHFSSAYYRAIGGGFLYTYERDGDWLVLPFHHQDRYWIGNAYNFGGPVGDQSLTDRFVAEFDEWKEQRNLSERCTISPFINTGIRLHRDITTKEAVMVYLTLPNQFRQTTKHMIQKATEAGVTTTKAYVDVNSAAKFQKIYNVAAERLDMKPHWRYSDGFFFRVLNELGPERSALFFTEVKGKTQAGCLLIFDKQVCYYHWAAAFEYDDLGTNHFQVATIIDWARTTGRHYLFLGGGLQPDDGLFRFKAGFTPQRIACHSYTTTPVGGIGW